MKKFCILAPLVLFTFVTACKQAASDNQICLEQKIVSVQFQIPFEYSKKDTLFIDGVSFTHTQYADSIRMGNYLPTSVLVYAEVGEKQIKQPTNIITMGRALGLHLRNSGKYQLLRAPELITTGKLTFERKDGKAIEMCYPKNYGMTILKNN
ncbi:MAG: hypothetical protein AAF554_17865 [Bacteroidota bacterium]